MNLSRVIWKSYVPLLRGVVPRQQLAAVTRFSTEGKDFEKIIHSPEHESEPRLPEYKEREGESLETRKARLFYQSRKRGMLENDLLLSTFCSKYLDTMSESQLKMYDTIINKPNNDWDIYYWLTGQKEIPAEYNNEVLHMMIEHSKNKDMENRTRMPDIKYED